MNSMKQDILLKIFNELKYIREQVMNHTQLLGELPQMKEQIDKIPSIQEQLAEIPGMKKQLAEIPRIKEQMAELPRMKEQIDKIPSMQKQLDDLQKEMKEIKQEVRNLSGSVAKIEVEHGQKLEALFDAFKLHSEKIDDHNKRIIKCENTLNKHDDQIYILNSKIQNA